MVAPAGMDTFEILKHTGIVAKSVLLVLLLFSLISWGIIIDRIIIYRKLFNRSRLFYQGLRKSVKLSEIANSAKDALDSPIREIFLETYRELHDQLKDNLGTGTGSIVESAPHSIKHPENIERSMDKAIKDQVTFLEFGLSFLATTASTTPFIGLFGTVWGIMDAFRSIGIAGNATLASVAPGISEALITTAAGLGAAIPALIAYNLLGRKVRTFQSYMEQFCLDLHNFITKRYS